MIAFLGECIAISRVQMGQQCRIITVGFIMRRLRLISSDGATQRTRYNFCRTSVHKLREVHSFQPGGGVAEACFDKPFT